MATFADGENNGSIRTKINAAITYVDAQQYATRSSAVTAISGGSLVPVNGVTYMIAGRMYKGQTGATAISDMPGMVPVGDAISPAQFGGTYDGVADDTAAIAACFAFATAENIPVTFAGLTHMSVEADAQIEFDVSVDFAGCQIKARNGIIGTPSASTTTYMFRAKDAATPVVTGTATGLTSSNLEDGSLSPTADFFQGPGNCFIQGNAGTPVLLPDRDKTGSMHYKQTFTLSHRGRTEYPLAVDISGYTSVDYRYRAMPERGRITVKNIVVDASTFNSASIVHVDRNSVTVDGVHIIPTGDDDDTFNRIIRFDDASFCELRNAPATAQTDGGDGGGTYLFSAHNCGEILLDNVHALNGWGMMSTFDIGSMRITRSTLNRADSHSGMFNVTLVDCTLQDIGLVYGWGGGFIRMTGCTLIDCPAIETRDDFGGFFFGSLYVDQWQMQSDDFAQTIVSLGGDTPIGVDGFSLPAAHGIYVGPGQRAPIGNGTNREIRPVWIAVDGSLTTGSVIAPAEINIDGIHCSGNWRMRCQIDMENMIDDPSNADGTRITISNCTPSRTVAAEDGMVYVPPNTVTGGGATGTLIMSNVRNASLNTLNTTGLAHFLFNCSITFAKTADNVRLQIDGGALAEPQLHNAETESPLGGAASTNDDYLSLRNVTVEHDDWDLSNVYAAIGCEIRTGRNPTLPATATKATMFTGFQVAGF